MTDAAPTAGEGALRSIAQAIELKDPYTRGHCDRVARYALLIAERLGLSEDRKREIKYGSWLHDCGKIGVPEAILNFEGPLTEDQLEVVRNHPRWGAEVARQAGLSETVIAIIFHHHEREDGKGYPAGLRGPAIPLEARIVAAADTVDAVTTDRPYRKGNDPEVARRFLLSLRGKALAPDITDILLAVLAESAGAESGPAREGSIHG
jgi:putative two-component system response regulator